MSAGLTRRGFLAGTAGAVAARLTATAGADSADEWPIPRRTLGKTGVKVPILGYGTAPTGERRSLEHAVELYHQAIDLGVNYFDTAEESTGYGKAQYQLGFALKDRRSKVFLATKLYRPRGDDAMRLLEQNLKLLQTDHADLVYAHSIGHDPEMPLEVITAPDGVLAFLQKAKREGLCRFIGISGHNRPWKFVRVLHDWDIDVMMNAVNFVDRHTYGFEKSVWPDAARKGVGLVAMKVFGGERGKAMTNSMMPRQHHDLAVRYALSLPNVACAVIGMATIEELKQNVERVKAFKPLSPEEAAEAESIGKEIAARWQDHLGAVT